MLRSIKSLQGIGVSASDGDVGHVRDAYFDSRKWVIRYLVVDTGVWLPGRHVLVSPHAIATLSPTADVLSVNLERKRIEEGPSTEAHKPVSRQHEEAFHRHYGWQPYWSGSGLWGQSDLPEARRAGKRLEKDSPVADETFPANDDPNLWSVQAVLGYLVQKGDTSVGLVTDLLFDEDGWVIEQLALRSGHRFSGKDETLPVGEIERLNYDRSTVFVRSAGTDVASTAPLVANS